MVVQLDELQKDMIYRFLAQMDMERYQDEVLMAINGKADPDFILRLLHTFHEEGQSAAYQQGMRIGENYGAETALRLLVQRIKNRERNTSEDIEPAKTG